jgi:curved DNA-binding protein CbpA
LRDAYAVLGVSPSDSLETIRVAYHALARLHHPDLGGDEKRMAEINGAWVLVRDPMHLRIDLLRRTTPPTPPAGPPWTAQSDEPLWRRRARGRP